MQFYDKGPTISFVRWSRGHLPVKERMSKILIQNREPVSTKIQQQKWLPPIWRKHELWERYHKFSGGSIVKKIYLELIIQNWFQWKIPLAGRLKSFKRMWKILTRDQEILEIVPRYTITILSKSLRRSFPILFQKRKFTERISHDGKEVEDLLSKGVINLTDQQKHQFLSTLFLALKKNGNQRPVTNLKQLNQFIPYLHFKEGLHCLKKVLLEYASWIWTMLVFVSH